MFCGRRRRFWIVGVPVGCDPPGKNVAFSDAAPLAAGIVAVALNPPLTGPNVPVEDPLGETVIDVEDEPGRGVGDGVGDAVGVAVAGGPDGVEEEPPPPPQPATRAAAAQITMPSRNERWNANTKAPPETCFSFVRQPAEPALTGGCRTGPESDCMSKLRVGIVGSGFGGTVHAPAYELHPRFEVVAIASPTNAERVARERNIPHAFRSAQAMLDGVELDVVSVASPPFDHHPSVMAALAAGKHILCEKPFALTLAQAEEMLAAAEGAGVAHALAFEFRYVPAVVALKELIDNGHLGALREIEVSRLSRELLERNTSRARSWWFSREQGGGVANSVMPHFFDLANHLAGRTPRATHGLLRTANPRRADADGAFESTVADGAFAYVDYGDGLIARISNDSTTVIDSTTAGVHGEHRSAIANGTFFGDLTLFAIAEDEQDELAVKPSPHAKHGAIHPNLPFFLPLLDAFAERIDLDAPGVPTFADGLTAQQSLEAIGYGA